MPVDAGGGGGTSPSTSGSRTGKRTSPPPPPPPTVYWFRGTRYTSYAAYQAAVARYQQRVSLQQRQRAEQLRLQQLAAQRRRVALNEYWARVRRSQQRGELRALAEQQRGLAAQRVEAERKRLLAIARQRRESELARVRREAYDTIKSDARAFQQAQVARRNELAEQQQSEYERLARQEYAANRFGELVGLDFKVGETEARKRRSRLIESAQESGDYTKVFEWIKDAQDRTGGRFYDDELYRTAVERYNEQVGQYTEKYEKMRDRVNTLAQKGDLDAALALLQGPEFQEVARQIQRLVGQPGRGSGQFMDIVRLSQQISEARDRYLERVYLGLYANRDLINAGVSQLEAVRRQFSQEWGGGIDMRGLREGLGPERPLGNLTLRQWVERQSRLEQARSQRIAEMSMRERMQALGWTFRPKVGWTQSTPEGDDQFVLSGSDARRWLSGDPRVQMRLASGTSYAQEAHLNAILAGTGHSYADVQTLIDRMLKGSSFKERNDASDALIKLIEDAAVERMRPAYAAAIEEIPDPYLRRFRIAELAEQREALIKQLMGYIGLERPGGLLGGLDKLTRAPIVGQGLGALGLGSAWVQSLLVDARAALYGEEAIQLLDVDKALGAIAGSLIPGGNPRTEGIEGIGRAWEQSPEVQALYQEYRRVIDDPGTSWEERAHAIMALSAGYKQGIGAFFLDMATDPLVLLAPSRFVRAGQLAISEAGGLRAAVRGTSAILDGQVPTVLKDYARFLTPRWLDRSTGISATNAGVFRNLSRETGLPVPELRAFSDDALRELVERAAKGQKPQEIAEHIGAFKRLWEEKPQNAQQLMTWAQREFQKQQGLFVDPLSLQRQINDAVKLRDETQAALARQAEIEAAEALRRQKLSPLQKLREQREGVEGVPAPVLPNVPKPVGGQAVKVRRLEQAVREAVAEQAALAEKAAAAAESLRTLGPKLVVERQAAYRQLDETLTELRRYDDFIDPDSNRVYGVINSRRRALREYRESIGLTSEEIRPFRVVDGARLQGDWQFLRTQLDHALQMRAQAKGLQKKIWDQRLARLYAAREGLELEQKMLSGSSKTADRIVSARKDAVLKRFLPNRIARPAFTRRAADEELSRELHVRAFARELSDPPPVTADDVVRARVALRTLSETKLHASTPELKDLIDTLGDVSVAEAYQVIRQIMKRPGGEAVWWDSFIDLQRVIDKHIDVRALDRYLDFGHMDVEFVPDLGYYRRLDKQVQAAIVEARGGFRRKGAQRAARVTRGGKKSGPLVLGDTDAPVVLAKLRALDSFGHTMQEYDELRAVLGDISRRDLVTRRLQRAAERLSRLNGKSVKENFLALREARRVKEAKYDVEEFINDPAMWGRTDEELFHLWDQAHAIDETKVTKRLVTPYQARVLDEAFARHAGFARDQSHLGSRLLGGVLRPPRGTRLVRDSDFEGYFKGTGVPAYVVPRPKPGEALSDAQRLLTDQLAHGVFVGSDGIYVWEDVGRITVRHELFHALMFSDRFGFDRGESLVDWWVRQPEGFLRGLWDQFEMRTRYPKLDPVFPSNRDAMEELLAELYAVANEPGSYLLAGREISWDIIRARYRPGFDLFALDQLGERLRALKNVELDPQHFGFGTNYPPLHNRRAARQWLVDNGFWSPKTAEEIKTGARIWSIDDERDFWMANYGVAPEWTNRRLLRSLLDDPQEYYRRFREWGFFDDDFERVAAGVDIEVQTLHEAMAFGARGVKKARTVDEMRYWFAERYGDLVSPDGGKTFTSVPWLMNMDEYQSWFGRMGANVDTLKALGLEIDPTLATPEMMASLSKAFETTVARHLERMRKRLTSAGADVDTWLPEEQMRFAYEVVDAIIETKAWRSVWSTEGLARDALFNGIGQMQRLFIIWQPAFPIMNFIDAFGPKAVLLSILRNGGRYVHFTKKHWQHIVPDLESVGDDLTLTWGTTRRKPWLRIGDHRYSPAQRSLAVGQTITEFPLRASAKAEGVLRLNFARSLAGRTYDDLVKGGMDPALAESLARFEAHKALKTFFSVLDSASEFEKALNQIIPFFTYTYKNFALGLRIIYEAPWLVNAGQNLANQLEDLNRQKWAELYPDAPFPEDDVNFARLWIESPWGTMYDIDLSVFSDWTRAIRSAADGVSVDDVFRVVHPWQTALSGLFTGQPTMWGAPADWKNLSPWFGLFDWLSKGQPFNPIDPKSLDLAQWISQMLFFKAFGRIDPVQAEITTFFGLMQVDEDRAWAYYEEHPNIAAYFQLNGKTVDPTKKFDINWFAFATDAEIDAYQTALAGYISLRDELDAAIKDNFYLEPWSREAREAKQLRYFALSAYVRKNPILQQAWMWKDAAEWASEAEAFRVDLAVEDFFNIPSPTRGDYKTDLAYQKAVLAYLDARENFLRQHPAVADRLQEGRTAVEKAWADHELQWAEILEDQARLRIKIIKENMLPEPDRKRLEILYRISEENYAALDMEAMRAFYDALGNDLIDNGQFFGQPVLDLVSRAIGRAQRIVALPGRADFFYERASDEERARIRLNERYHRALDALWKRIDGDYTKFYDELHRSPWLREEYLRRNPEKKKTAAYAVGISAIFRKAKSGLDFYRLLEQNPALMAEYFRRHPDKAARYRAGKEYFGYISRWVELLKADRFDEAMTYWDSMPGWVQEKYLLEHPDSKMRRTTLQSSAYSAALSKWVDLLQAKEFVEADRYFKNLPDWIKERYFESHPDQRAKHELTSRMLQIGASYFLSRSESDRLRILRQNPELHAWLKEHGGNEAAWRGLIFAIYRAIPSSNPWLKRTFRERYPELFGVEAQGERRREKVFRTLSEHPEMIPYYEQALALQTRLYIEQLRRNRTPPKPLVMERKRRLRKRRKRRAARLHSSWSLHERLRRF